ncbi:iron ABC transporter permease [Roseovarius aestuarii]|nr:iron ABC transporter permease [Roseovarius aestuarii]
MKPGVGSIVIAVCLAIAGVLTGASLGVDFVTPAQLFGALVDSITQPQPDIISWRLQRVVGAFFVGFCLGIAGVIFQGAFRNPLAEPFLLGSAAGGSLGAALAILLPTAAVSSVGLPVMAFLGAWGATLTVLGISRFAKIDDAAGMLLVGIAVAALLGATRSMTTLVLSDETVSLQAMLSWTLGSLQTPMGATLALFGVLSFALLAVSMFLAKGLDILGFGEPTAQTMGMDVARFLGVALTIGALTTGLAVAWGGVLGFVGLVVPHMVRWWVGERHGPLLVHSALIGGGLLAALDGVSRALIPPSEIPLGLITAFMGAPFFLLLIVRRYR